MSYSSCPTKSLQCQFDSVCPALSPFLFAHAAVTFQIQLDHAGVILQLIGDLALIAPVVLQGDISEDQGGIPGSVILQFSPPSVGTKGSMLGTQSHEDIGESQRVYHLRPLEADAVVTVGGRLVVVTAG